MQKAAGESVFTLATRVCANVADATDADLMCLKQILRQYKRLQRAIDESEQTLRVSDAFEATDARVTFGVNTSVMEGSDFYITVLNDDTVLYSDGVDENEISMD